jgi:uncharacterized protein YdaU (DUF1376 family)
MRAGLKAKLNLESTAPRLRAIRLIHFCKAQQLNFMPYSQPISGKQMTNLPWYPFYPNSYTSRTSHLTMLQHGALRLLLDECYRRSGPLPPDIAALNRICRASNKSDRDAIKSVLKEFFHLAEDGYSNERANIEIIKRLDVSSKRSGAARSRHAKAPANAIANAEQKSSISTHTLQSTVTVTDKEKSSSGAPAPDLAFSGRVIRLSHEHLARWKKTYYAIPDLRAELEVADAYYFQTPTADGKLFFLVSSWLKREHAKLVKQEKDEREERNRIY